RSTFGVSLPSSTWGKATPASCTRPTRRRPAPASRPSPSRGGSTCSPSTRSRWCVGRPMPPRLGRSFASSGARDRSPFAPPASSQPERWPGRGSPPCSRFPGRAAGRAVVRLPMVLPPVVAGVALLTALGRFGVIGRLLAHLGVTLPFTPAGAAVAAAFVAGPFAVLSFEAGFHSLDERLIEAARTLGASRWRTLRTVTLPLLRPQLVAGLALTWARARGGVGP